jgi:adenylate cyclase
MLTVIVETQTHRRIVRALLDTYVGHRTGERVLSGAVKRGDGETIRAVIWYCDLRGFTTLSDALPRDLLLDLLNQYFEIMVNAVSAEGGEVLKFIGDGMLAIFELRESDNLAQRCAAALRAARAARATVALRNPIASRRVSPKSVMAARYIWAKLPTAISVRPTGSTSPSSAPLSIMRPG